MKKKNQRKILMISALIPLPKLKRENDIIVKTINEIKASNSSFSFRVLKPIIYSNFLLGWLKEKWKQYYKYLKQGSETVQGNKIEFFPWIAINGNRKIISFLAPINWFLYRRIIMRIIQNSSFDLIHAQGFFPDGYIAMKLSRELDIPFILTIRGTNSKILELKKVKQILRNANKITTPSFNTSKLIAKGREAILIPHGVDNVYFINKSKVYNNFRLLTVCRLLDWKNIDKVIIALHNVVSRKDFDFEYRIIGDGHEYLHLEQLIKKYNLEKRIKLFGFLNSKETIPHYYWSNIYIQPSYPETMGRSFFEAAASGNVIIGTKNSGVHGILDNNVSGLFVNHERIIQELSKVFSSIEPSKLSEIAMESRHIVEEFRTPLVIQRYINLYISVNKSSVNGP